MIIIFLALLIFSLWLFWFFMKLSFKMLIWSALFIIIFLLLCCFSVEAHEYTPEDIVAIGKLVQHECPHESELGQRLVVDTILNRVESDEFPNTVEEVLSQPGQYCTPKEFPPKDIYKLIAEEVYTRTNDKVLWYRTKKYHTYGEPIIQEGNHYFSGR